MNYGLQLLARLVASVTNGIGTEGALSMLDLEHYLKDADRLNDLEDALLYVSRRQGFGNDAVAPVKERARLEFISAQVRAARSFFDTGRSFWKNRVAPEWKQELEQPTEVIQPDAYRDWVGRTSRFTVMLEDGSIEAENLNEDNAVIMGQKLADAGTWRLEGDFVIVRRRVCCDTCGFNYLEANMAEPGKCICCFNEEEPEPEAEWTPPHTQVPYAPEPEPEMTNDEQHRLAMHGLELGATYTMEQARLAGMAGGCAAYNEAIGSDLGGQSYCSNCLKDYGSGHHCCDC